MSTPKKPSTCSEAWLKYYRAVGSSGGLAAAANMTPEQRKARAVKASKAAAKARAAKAQKAGV